MATPKARRLSILTSGGDAPGMNAVVRAAVRTALDRGCEIYAVINGFQGLVDGGDRIRRMTWGSVGGILHKGGTVIGTARCAAFRTREGRRQAAKNLVKERIDGLIAVGGDGTLTGADLLRREWSGLLKELVEAGEVTAEEAAPYPRLSLVGLAGSIDNDFAGTDMSIGADTALHRIVEAIDALSSTAASHQRTFVVEVMGRNCGYLALMSALATGAGWVLIPESPPEAADWDRVMCERLAAGRAAGRKHSTVIVAEGARDREGTPIDAERVRKVLEERLGTEARVTVLGHVQRGGSPSAFDRLMGTLLGHAAVEQLLSESEDEGPYLIGLRASRIARSPLMEAVQKSKAVGEAVAAKEFDRAMELRGPSYRNALRVMRTLVRAVPHPPKDGQRRLRFGVLTAGAPSPGMNACVRAAVRLAIDQGHSVTGIRNGFQGLVAGGTDLAEMDWRDVHGWVALGGSELGTNRHLPTPEEMPALARTVEKAGLEGLLIVGGFTAYAGAHLLLGAREEHPSLRIPLVCLPAAIDNHLPGTDFSIGADTALNAIVWAVDRIKQSAVAWKRCFVVEVMGRYCGYLALVSGIVTGAERVYTHEEGITLSALETDLGELVAGFRLGKRLGLLIRNENASAVFTTDFLRRLFEEEGKGLFDARQAILGHLQQGGDPTPFDRIQATRLSVRAVEALVEEAGKPEPLGAYAGFEGGRIVLHPLAAFPEKVHLDLQRPREQWWLSLVPVSRALDHPAPVRAERAR